LFEIKENLVKEFKISAKFMIKSAIAEDRQLLALEFAKFDIEYIT
jgi:hypothetical protein